MHPRGVFLDVSPRADWERIRLSLVTIEMVYARSRDREGGREMVVNEYTVNFPRFALRSGIFRDGKFRSG
jgi:hypothetical protein